MLGESSVPNEKASLPLQVEPNLPALSQDGAPQRSSRHLWVGFGFAVFMLIGVVACARAPLASHVSERPSDHHPSRAFITSINGPAGIRTASTDPQAVVLPGVKQKEYRHPVSVPHMSAQATADMEYPIKDITRGVFGRPGLQDFDSQWPYTVQDMSRLDETDDSAFYAEPKLVYHISAETRAALTNYYATEIAPGSDILDIASSWVSHYPSSFPDTMGKICGTGMNELELQENKQLTGGFVVSDLNKDPTLQYPDESFDVVTCVVSVDYLNKPREVFKEVGRVLKPGGKFIVSISSRMFQTKAVAVWMTLGTTGRLKLIGDYFHYSDAGFTAPRALDISPNPPKSFFDAIAKFASSVQEEGVDPIYIVESTKEKQ